MLRYLPSRLRPAVLLLPLVLPATACTLPNDVSPVPAAATTTGGKLPPPPSDRPPGVAPGPGPGDQHFDFAELLKKGQEVRPIAQMRQQEVLNARYDLSDRPSELEMTRGKPVQEGVRARLPDGRHLGRAGRPHARGDQARGTSSPGLSAAAPPQPHRGRHGVPAAPHRGGQAADRPRPRALRPGLRPARPLPARSSRPRSS